MEILQKNGYSRETELLIKTVAKVRNEEKAKVQALEIAKTYAKEIVQAKVKTKAYALAIDKAKEKARERERHCAQTIDKVKANTAENTAKIYMSCYLQGQNLCTGKSIDTIMHSVGFWDSL